MDQKGLDAKYSPTTGPKSNFSLRISFNAGRVRQIWSIKTTHSDENYWDIQKLTLQHGRSYRLFKPQDQIRENLLPDMDNRLVNSLLCPYK